MSQPHRRRIALPRHPAGWLALGIAALCVGIEVALSGADAGLWGSAAWRPRAYQNGAFWAGLLRDWRPNYPLQPVTMFASYAVLHGGAWHLLGNMAALWSLCRALGPRLDAGRLAALWAAATLAGGLAFGVLAPGALPMVGASGALFGLAGAWLAWEAAARRAAGLSRRPVLRILLVLIALHPVLWLLQAGHLAWQAHLGGLLAGAALARIIGPARPR